MKFIGNIVTESKALTIPFFNIVDTLEKADRNIPTLIIGWEKAKYYFQNVKILEWNICNNIYWTFGRREKGERFEVDIEKFKNLCLKDLYKKINYVFFNVLTEDLETKRNLFGFLKTNKITAYIENDFFYFFNNANTIYGISLRDIEYEGENKNKFLSLIYSNKNIEIVQKESITYDIRVQLQNKISYVSYLFSN